jgi:tRNA dimethylallyltransferase
MQPLIVIIGPTASGKTRLAVEVARQRNGEIISADSRQVYRDMNIGTGKDLSEYIVDGQAIRYHLIDIVDAGADYNLNEYQQDFGQVLADIHARNRTPVLVGGSGLYVEAVLKNHAYTRVPVNESLRVELDVLSDMDLWIRFKNTPSAYSDRADTTTRKRTTRAIEISTFLRQNPDFQPETESIIQQFNPSIFGLDLPVELRRERISRRLRERLRNGMINEVAGLLARGVPAEKLIFYGLEYKFIVQHLTGELDRATMTARLETAIHQFAKRQMTYFRKMERDGLAIHWLDGQRSIAELAEEVIGFVGLE